MANHVRIETKSIFALLHYVLTMHHDIVNLTMHHDIVNQALTDLATDLNTANF